jgi:hypothetical protein
MGATDEVCEMIYEKARDEEQVWLQHIERYKRIDIVDRYVLEEYLASPDYYQMPLTAEELQQQVARLERIMCEENYTLCLTPEAVNLCFEIRGGEEVRIRSDRRNKSLPRPGRISSIVMREPDTAHDFEREFWSLFRLTEREFKEKGHVLDWINTRAARYAPQPKARQGFSYHVFLCYNSRNNEEVRQVAIRLRERGVNPWFDEWCLVPGRPWQRALESEIGSIGAAAIFVGRDGLEPWIDIELEALLRQFVERGLPVIPVLLPSADGLPSMPSFLNGIHFVDLRTSSPDPFVEIEARIQGLQKQH